MLAVRRRYESRRTRAKRDNSRGGQEVLRRPPTLAVVVDGTDWQNGDQRIVEKSRPKSESLT